MAEKKVTITKDPASDLKCKITPRHFEAQRSDFVTFEFKGVGGAAITFSNGKSPFGRSTFAPGRLQVNDKAPLKTKFSYTVTWPEASGDGSGAGSGEIIP